MGIYLSPVWHTIRETDRRHFGYIVGIHGGGVTEAVKSGHTWMLDNGVYSGRFKVSKWTELLEKYQKYAKQCIGIVIPDFLYRNSDKTVVGDWVKTLEMFHGYSTIVSNYGYKKLFVTQDGIPIHSVPWGEIDGIFVGGSDKHKLVESYPIIMEAIRIGKWVHVGRVNSEERIMRFWMANSWDGTMLKSEPSVRRQQILLNSARVAESMRSGLQGQLI